MSLVYLTLRSTVAGADVNLQDCKGNTALHLSSSWGNLDTSKALIRGGGNS